MKTTGAKSYVIVFVFLIGLAVLNIVLAEENLRGWNTTVTLGIACAQAFLLGAFFMHLRDSPRFTWIIVFAGFFFVAILAVFLIADNYGRSSQPIPRAWETPGPTGPAAEPAAKSP